MLQYLTYRRNPVGLQAQNPIEASGIMYVEWCGECGGKQPITDSMSDVKSPTGAICRDCSTPWETREEHRFVGEVRVAPHKRSAHEKLGKFLDLGVQFERLLTQEENLQEIWYYVSNVDGVSLRGLVVSGPLVWPEGPTTVYGVGKLVDHGREIWSVSCRKIGIKV
jgi:hypothetical protein